LKHSPEAMVKEGKLAPKVLSAYPLTDQPIGSSLPYVPQARPWDAQQLNAPPLAIGGGGRRGTSVGASEVEKHAVKSAPQNLVSDKMTIQRPTASVTDIPGAAAPAKRLEKTASFRSPAQPIKKGAMQRMQIEDSEHVFQGEANVQHFTFPAILWCVVGVICPPFLCCGLRFTGSANAVAKFFGWASIFIFCCYIAGGMILFAQ